MAGRARGRERSRSRGSRLSPWLAVAAAVHAGLLATRWAGDGVAPPEHAPSALEPLAPIELDLIKSPDELAANAATARERPANERGGAADGVHAARRNGVARATRSAATARGAAARSGSDSASPEAVKGDALVPEVAGAPGSSDGAAGLEGAAGEAAGPRLSLRDLGVDRGSNPFIGSPADLPTERQRLNQRLRQSLLAESARRDQQRGLGPEGPVVVAVKDIVLASATAPNTSALLRVRVNGAGAVTRVDVLQADRDDDEWRRIAEQLVRALAGKKLRVPASAQRVSFDLRVISRVQLPSGADPGLAIDLFGLPLKEGDGARSTRLSLLSPVVKEVEVPNSNGTRVPVVTFALIAGAGDLADIGAVARRLVTAYLVAMETEIAPDAAAGVPTGRAPSPAPALPAP